MTENELRINGKSFDETISQLEEFMESDDVHGELFGVLRSARDFMENMNEEIQQYRAIGTVEGYENAIKAYTETYISMKEYKSKLQEIEAIGTVKEFKALKEKNEPKKIEFMHNRSDTVSVWKCHCGNVFLTKHKEGILDGTDVNYCCKCGQAIDWSEEE